MHPEPGERPSKSVIYKKKKKGEEKGERIRAILVPNAHFHTSPGHQGKNEEAPQKKQQ